MSMTKAPGFDTRALTEQIKGALDESKSTFPPGVETTLLFQQKDFIDNAIGNLTEAIRDGAIMVTIVLFLFLLNFRTTFITLMAMPLSFGITMLVFKWFGISVNSMTLGGLAVAIGMVVDDAIVDVENVFRRLRENAALLHPHPRLQVIAKASGECGSISMPRCSSFWCSCRCWVDGRGRQLFALIAIADNYIDHGFLHRLPHGDSAPCSILLNPKVGHEHKDGFLTRGMKWLLE